MDYNYGRTVLLSKTKTTFSGISPSEFFYRNRDLAGFSNPAKALYTATRELVENSLDACESSEILPNIYVRMTPVIDQLDNCLLYTSPSPRDRTRSRMPSSA